MLTTFLDASQRVSDVLCVAGVAFSPQGEAKAVSAWVRLMGERIAHLTDLHARRGAFKDMSPEQAGTMLQAQVRIIRRNSALVVAFSCDLQEIQVILPTTTAPGSEDLLDGFRTGYATLAHMVLHTLGRMTVPRHDAPDVNYVFEAGDLNQNQLRRYIDHATSFEPMRRVYNARSCVYLEKRQARLLETADVLAWEWGKHVERVRQDAPMRPSLRELLGGECGLKCESSTAWAQHLTGASLRRFCTKVSALLAATSREEIAEVIRPGDPQTWESRAV